MRLFLIITLATVLNGCSLFGTYVWSHPQKAQSTQLADKAECLSISSIVFGSNEALLALAKNPNPKPNPRLEADCLVTKGYNRTFIPKQT
jgi:hypothetical protein